MIDNFGRRINYLRISVTDRCNLRCVYCMPKEGIPLVHHDNILTFDEIVDFSTYAVSKGIDKIRVTGGEPLVRRGICDLVKKLSNIEGVRDIALTTNGQLLKEMAYGLKVAGLQRLNISLDTIDPHIYFEMTRGGSLQKVFDGIAEAKKVGFGDKKGGIKINCVLTENTTDETTNKIKEYASAEGLELRFIKCMNLKNGEFYRVIGGNGGDCPNCNRLRLTSTGELRPCLFSNISYDIRKIGYEKALELALNNKPEKGIANNIDSFYTIGG